VSSTLKAIDKTAITLDGTTIIIVLRAMRVSVMQTEGVH